MGHTRKPQAYSRRDRHALDTDEFQAGRLRTLHFQAQLNRFADFHHQFIQRGGVGMTARQLRYRGHIHAFFVALNDTVELERHTPHATPLPPLFEHGDFEALKRDFALPFGVRGPVDFWALARLAALCLSEAMREGLAGGV